MGSPSGTKNQYIEVEMTPGSTRCKGVYIIETDGVPKVFSTFYFSVDKPVSPRKPSPGERNRRQASPCHQGPRLIGHLRGNSLVSVESFVVMESDEKKPKLKPIKGKETGEILAFEMTYPELYPQFFAKFKRQRLKSRKVSTRNLTSPRWK